MNTLASYIAGEQQKARQTYENAIVAEANGQRIKNPQALLDALAILNLTSRDFENAVEVEREYSRLASIADEEESLRAAMHAAGEEYSRVVEECKSAMKEIEERKRQVSARYDLARSDFQRANDASIRLSKLNSIQGRLLQSKLDAIMAEQKEVGRKLNQVRDSLRQNRMNVNSFRAEWDRTQEQRVHDMFTETQQRIRDLESEEAKLVKQSEAIQQRYEHTRLTRGVGEDDTSGGNQDGDL